MKKIWFPLLAVIALVSCAPAHDKALKNLGPGAKSLQVYNFDYWNLKEKNFAQAKLYSASFREANLSHANFSGADLLQTDFRRANLYKANFTASNVHRSFLFEAKLRGAIFDKTDFREANFTNFNLQETSFQNARLEGAIFKGANLISADFSESLIENTSFAFANLENSKFKNTRLEGIKLTNLNLKNADFTGATLIDVAFEGSNLVGVNFSGATLRGVTVTKVRLFGSSFIGATIIDSDFTAARLTGSDFSKARLTNVNLSNITYPAPLFASAKFSNMKIEELDFTGANFQNAVFSKTTFNIVALENSNFAGSLAKGLLLKNSDLTGSNLENANFEKARFKNTGFEKVNRTGLIFPRMVEPKTGTVFIQLPQGCFQMGDLFNENMGFTTKPHLVCLSDYWLARTAVTQEVYLKSTGKNPSKFKMREPDSPVEQVTTEDILGFIASSNAQSKWKLRLPTEAEWEYACRGLGQKLRFGNDRNDAAPDEMAFRSQGKEGSQYSMIGHGKTFHSYGGNWDNPVPVNTFKPNPLGFYDLSGNVAEVVSDYWDSKAYKNHNSLNPNVAKPTNNNFLTKRGGSYKGGAADLRCAKRSFLQDKERKDDTGFRLAVTEVP